MSLNNLGIHLSNLGRREKALDLTQESVKIRRQLAKTNPTAHLPNLAMSLGALAQVQAAGPTRLSEALAAAEEAAAIFTQLAQQLPQVYTQRAAFTWMLVARLLDRLGHTGEAAAIRNALAKATTT
jgi:tetratricopeptide (TPR) repeat protein